MKKRITRKFAIFFAVFIAFLMHTALVFAMRDHAPSASLAQWFIDIDARGNVQTKLIYFSGPNGLGAMGNVKDELLLALQKTRLRRTTVLHFSSSKSGLLFSAYGLAPLERRANNVAGLIRPDPILRLLSKAGPVHMYIHLTIPRLGTPRGPIGSREPAGRYEHAYYVVNIDPGQTNVEDLSFEFGYSAGYNRWIASLPILILSIPVALVLFFRKRSIALAQADAAAAWFGYWRLQLWIGQGVWIAWIIFLELPASQSFVVSIFGLNPVMKAALLVLPPSAVLLLTQWLARPVWRQVRGVERGSREMLLGGFLAIAARSLPLCFILIGINSLYLGAGAMLWFAAAMVSAMMFAWLYGKVSRTTPRTLHGGEMRKRVMELAAKAGVKINQVRLMPAQHYQMGNAFAARGRTIVITDYLLRRLTKRETDSVLAHEIGHLERRHLLFLALGFIFFLFALERVLGFGLEFVSALGAYHNAFADSHVIENLHWFQSTMLFPVSLIAAWLLYYFMARRFEYSADQFSTLLTGDPESMITALVKLSKMNLTPIYWGRLGGKLMTHPSTINRVGRIARRHGITEQRLQSLITMPDQGDQEGYSIPDEATSPDQVYSSELRRRDVLSRTLGLVLTAAATPIFIAWLVGKAALPSASYGAGLILAPGLCLLFLKFNGQRICGVLRCNMAKKLAQEGIESRGLHFVALSPEDRPRMYENGTFWDVGFLALDRDAFVYIGDKIRFSAPRPNIVSIAQGVSHPSWFPPPETYVTWSDGNGEHVFHLHSLDESSMAAGKQSQALLREMLDWREGTSGVDRQLPLHPPLPVFPDVGGVHPRESLASGTIAAGLILIAFLTFGASSALQLGRFASWYAFAIGGGALLMMLMPVLRYKEADDGRDSRRWTAPVKRS